MSLILLGGAAACFLPATASAGFVSSIVMSGLDDPRGLAFAPDGSLYVTEAGSPFAFTSTTPFVLSQGQPEYFNTSGSIGRLSSGIQSEFLTGLPSLFAPSSGDVVGAQGIGFSASGDMYFTVGLGSNPTTRGAGLLSSLGLLMKVPAGGGLPVVVADLSGYEALNNPAGGPVDSNPYQLAVTPGGILVADAGGNDVLKVSFTGTITLDTTLPALGSGAEPVPTSLAVAPDGTVYVSQLTGFPFTPGAASVFRIDGLGLLTPVGTGFTNVVDMEYGPDGNLYVLEIAHNGLLSGNPTGGLWELNPLTGAKTLLMSDGLVSPTAIAFDSHGTLFVTTQGETPGSGEVLKLTAVPEPSTWGISATALLAGLVGLRRFRRSRAVA